MKTLRAFLLLGCSLFLSLQTFAQCGEKSITNLQANQVKAPFSNAGDFFYEGGLAVPYLPGAPTLRTLKEGSLVLTGVDQNGDIRASVAGSHSFDPATDFGTGPLDDQTGQPLPNGCSDFDHIWEVYRFEVLQFLRDYEDNGRLDQPIPRNIKAWPARGNPFFKGIMGFDLPDQDLAPFFDRNGNGRYEPQEGEYPIVGMDLPLLFPDHLLWAVFNDMESNNPNTEAGMGVEVHLMAYGLNCTDNEVLSKTVFTRHKVYMKGPGPINEFTAGYRFAPQLGCGLDDAMGTDTTLNSIYIYNQDPLDGDSDCICENEGNSYCDTPPVQAITALNQPLWRSMMYTGWYTGPPVMGEPSRSLDYYYYLKGLWRDGTPLISNGFGHQSVTSGQVANFIFYDNPTDPDGWSMYAQDLSATDIRPVFSFAPHTFSRGDSIILDLAFSFHQEPGASHLENVQVMQAEIPTIRAAYENGFSTICNQTDLCSDDCVWPGDTDQSGQVDEADLLALGIAAGHHATGGTRTVNYFDWIPQKVEDWPSSFANGVNYKHADSNGDGVVDTLDKTLIDLHYGQTIPNYEALTPKIPEYSEVGLRLENHIEEVSANFQTSLPRVVRTKVLLGTEDQPVENLYGISFSVRFDTSLMEPPSQFLVINHMFEDFLGTTSDYLSLVVENPQAGRLDFSICKTDGQEITGWGELGEFWLQVRRDARTPNPDSTALITYEVVNLRAIDFAENDLGVGARADTTLAVDLIFDPIPRVTDLPVGQEYFKVSPNPTPGKLNLQLVNFKRDEKVEMTLMNWQSQILLKKELFFESAGMPLVLPSTLSNGLYLLIFKMTDGREFVHQVVLQRTP